MQKSLEIVHIDHLSEDHDPKHNGNIKAGCETGLVQSRLILEKGPTIQKRVSLAKPLYSSMVERTLKTRHTRTDINLGTKFDHESAIGINVSCLTSPQCIYMPIWLVSSHGCGICQIINTTNI